MDSLTLSVIIPVYNEEASIAVTVAAIDEVLATNGVSFEIIAVNDGSTDGSGQRLHEAAAQVASLRVIEHEENIGYGAAIKTGILEARSDTILIIDADQTYPVDQIPALLEQARDADMVVGSRTGPETHIPLIRKPAKYILKLLVEFLTGRKIPDMNSGFRIFPKQLARTFFHMLPDGFSFTTTITILAFHHGYRVRYVPVNYFKREGTSKIRPIRDTLNFLQLILRTVLYVSPLKIFVPASLFFLAISLVLYIIRVLFGPAFLVTIVLTFFCGFQLLVVGMLADLIDKRMR
jgi:glycosyltransferase involved in cell wall biosynthesis